MTSILLLFLSVSSQAQETCVPKYQVVYNACKETGRVVDTGEVSKNLTVATGACDPNAEAICDSQNLEAFLHEFRGASVQDLRVTAAYKERAEGKFCGKMTNLRAKEDVLCTITAKVPVYEMVEDPSCGMREIVETQGCYDARHEKVSVSAEFVKGCLAFKPQSHEELAEKVACLKDALKAQEDFRMAQDLPLAVYEGIQVQLHSLRQKLPSAFK